MAAIDLLLCTIIAILHLVGIPFISDNIGYIILGTMVIRFVIGKALINKTCFLWNKKIFNKSNLMNKKELKHRRISLIPKQRD